METNLINPALAETRGLFASLTSNCVKIKLLERCGNTLERDNHWIGVIVDESYRLIPLHGKHGEGKFAKVSPEDFESLSKLTWSAAYQNGCLYAVSYTHRENRFMHNWVSPPKQGELGDHINGDTLDNRRFNLRSATHTENMQNRAIHKNNKSGFKGVYFDRANRCIKGWRAQIRANGRKHMLGRFETAQEAAQAYDEAAKRLHGQYARLNFPK